MTFRELINRHNNKPAVILVGNTVIHAEKLTIKEDIVLVKNFTPPIKGINTITMHIDNIIIALD